MGKQSKNNPRVLETGDIGTMLLLNFGESSQKDTALNPRKQQQNCYSLKFHTSSLMLQRVIVQQPLGFSWLISNDHNTCQ
jgi:hypothetical protein